MLRTEEGSTGRLVQLCGAYYFFYVIFGVATKCFTGATAVVEPAMTDMEFLVWSTFGGAVVCLLVVFGGGWHRAKTDRLIRRGPLRFPAEYAYIIPSGICTAVVIPTTTLMYMLLKSVMVAMVVMRASVIVISRLVDEVQLRQGLLRKRVYWEEDAAVAFAIAAAASQLFWPGLDAVLGWAARAPAAAAPVGPAGAGDGGNPTAAAAVLAGYVVAYALRIYIMNYYKNTRPKGAPLDNKWFFSIEQISASVALAAAALLLYSSGWQAGPAAAFRDAVTDIHARWLPATLAGAVYGMVAFFSVFIFMFKGRTATFAGLVNRLTSLAAGTTATLASCLIFGGEFPGAADWVSLGLILAAVAFLTRAERKRTAELAAEKEAAAGAGA